MSKESIIGAKAGEGKQRQPVIAPDSARSVTRLQQVIGLSEGEIKGFNVDNIKLDGTPLSALSTSISCDYRFGSSNQTSIDGVDEVANEIGVGVELRSDREWIKAITNTNLDALGLRLRWSPLVTNHENGDRTGVQIVYSVYIAPDSGSYNLVLNGLIDDKTADSYERYHEFKLPPSNNGWMVRVVRETPNSESSLITDKMYVQAYSEIVKSKFNYPFTSLISLEYDAQTFPNIAKVSVEAEGMIIKVPTNYDAESRTYNGIWNGLFKLAYSNNPAWIYYDLVTNPRYGLGDKIKVNMVDKWALYKLSMYCDQMVSDGYGGLEPRFTCNVYLQSKERAYDILNRLTGLFRAINFWSGTEIVVDADIPQDTSYLYTNANVIDGLFEYAGTPATERYSVAKVAWDNPLNAYSTEYEAVSYEHLIKELGFRVLELDAWGCTSRGQALRAGRWALLAETDTITFKVGMDGYLALPGKVIEIQDEFYAGKSNGGRIKAIDATRKIITVDRDVSTIVGDTLSINTNSGEVLKYDIVSSAGKIITLSEAIYTDIDNLSIWVINSTTLVTQKYRVMTVKYDDVGEFTISATAYDSNKYEEIDNDIVFDDLPTSLVNPIAQDSVTDVQIESNNLVYQGLNNVNLTIKWVRAVNAVEYLVEFKKDNGTWLKLPTTGNNSITLDNVYAGTYIARVTALSAFGLLSLPAYSVNADVLGKLLPPSPPLNLRTSPAMFAVNILWDFPANSKDVAFTRIQTSVLDPLNMPDLTHVIEVDRAYPETKLTVDGMRIGYPKWFRAKLVDKLGFESPFTEWVQGESNEDPASVIELISGHISEGTLDQMLKGKIDGALGLAGEANSLAGQANAAASNAQSTANQASTKAQEAANAVMQEAIDRAAALQDGITQVTTDYKAGDAVVLGELVAYKASNDSAVAIVVQKAESAVAAGSTNSQAITELTGQVQAINNTKLDASAINNYYTKAESETATAGQISTFEASLALGGGWMDVGREGASLEIETGVGTLEVIDRMTNHFKLTSASDGSFSAYIGSCNNSSDIPVGTPYVLTGKIRASRANLYDRIYCRFNQYGSESYIYDQNDSSDWVNFTAKGVTNTGNYNAIDNIIGAYVPNSQEGDWVEFKDCRVSVNSDSLTATNANAIQTVNVEVARVNGEVVSTANSVSTLSSNVGLLQGSINEVRQTVTNNQESTNTLVTSLKSGMADADDVSMMMRNAAVLYEDLNFRNGVNGISVYNNLLNDALACTFTDKLPDNPVASTRQLQFIHSGGQTTPALGGFFQETWSRPNGVFLVKFVAKLPVGFSFGLGYNAYGDGAAWYFIGANEGTGKFKTYYGVYRCGATGSFGTVGFVYAQGPYPSPENPLIWYLASSTVYDCLDSKVAPDSVVNGIAEAKSTASTAVNKAEATALIAQNIQASVDNTNANISTNYYTKAEAENAVAGKIEQFSSTIAVGGDNLFTGTKTFNNEASENSNSSFQPSYGGFGQVFMPYGLFGTHMVVRTSSSWSGFYLKEADGVSWEAKEDMVLSFWANADAEVYVYGIASQLGQVALIPANQPMIKYEVLLPKGTPLRNAVNQGIVEFHLPNGGTLWYGAVMLQIGTKSSAWQPSSKESDAAVGSLKNTLTVQSMVIDGVKASYMVKMESNGVIGGFGMIQESGAMGAVVTTFGVNADTFYIGSPSLDKKPFIQRNEWSLINGVWVAPGTYLDTAYIANETVTNSKIANLAVDDAKIAYGAITTAKIGDAQITTAKIGDLQVDTLKIKDNAVSVAVAASRVSSLAIEVYGGTVQVDVNIRYRFDAYTSTNKGIHRWRVEVYRNGALIRTFDWMPWHVFVPYNAVIWVNFSGNLPLIIDRPGAGVHTYEVRAFSELGNSTSMGELTNNFNTSSGIGYESGISIMEIKK